MSALGQYRTCAVQNSMSVLPLKATVKADSATGHVCFTLKADMCSAHANVGYGPEADISGTI
jgi:hypothetical protein